MARFLVVILFSLSCAAANAQTTSAPVAPGSRNETQVPHISAVVVPVRRAVRGVSLPAQLTLRNDGSTATALFFDLRGTRWLSQLSEMSGMSHPLRPGELLCMNSAKYVLLKPGQTFTKRVSLEPLIEKSRENFVGVVLRIPAIFTGAPCGEVQFVEAKLTIRVVVYDSAAEAASIPGPTVMPVPQDRALSDLVQRAYSVGNPQEVYGTGSLADELRWQDAAGEEATAKGLAERARRVLQDLEEWKSKNQTANKVDREAAEQLCKDLESALSDRERGANGTVGKGL